MKEIINYYYNFYIEEIEENKNYSKFNYYGEEFYFVFFNRSEDELKDIVDICDELRYKGIRVHDIILNRDNKIITKVGDIKYLLLKLNISKDEVVNFINVVENTNKLKLNLKNSKL